MNALGIDRAVFDAMKNRPSRASVAAIGQRCVLDGAAPAAAALGLDALSKMMCDWSVGILEEAINGPNCAYCVRRLATSTLGELVLKAIRHGYRGISEPRCRSLIAQAQAVLSVQESEGAVGRIPAVGYLCDHLKQAVADGVFGALPDF
jgi:hypothetical protein